jgi:GNAT superfamily N-acetyltransferase
MDIHVLNAKGLHILAKKDAAEYSACCAEAYRQYPLMCWIFGRSVQGEALVRLFRTSFLCISSDSFPIADSERMRGVAVWLPPHHKGIGALSFITSGGWKLVRHIPHLLKYENYAQSVKQRIAGNDCWYLHNLAVRPGYQGQGIASQLLRPVLDECSRTGQKAYLETNVAKNVSFYEHFGFRMADESLIPGTNVKHYAMLFCDSKQ